MDTYRNFADLNLNEPDASFDIAYRDRKSHFLIFSPHAGGIEQGTSEICLYIAGDACSNYLFSGQGKDCKRLHITSTHLDEPVLLRLLSAHQFAISIHGMKNKMRNYAGADIFLGGLNRRLIAIATKILRECHFVTTNNIENSGSRLNGKDQRNIANKCMSGEGMQVEISEDLRSAFFVGDYRKKTGRNETTEAFKSFCDAIRQSIKIFEYLEAKT
jgi:phage replication-related protein YjqB (UPF0714/DUF867 family)